MACTVKRSEIFLIVKGVDGHISRPPSSNNKIPICFNMSNRLKKKKKKKKKKKEIFIPMSIFRHPWNYSLLLPCAWRPLLLNCCAPSGFWVTAEVNLSAVLSDSSAEYPPCSKTRRALSRSASILSVLVLLLLLVADPWAAVVLSAADAFAKRRASDGPLSALLGDRLEVFGLQRLISWFWSCVWPVVTASWPVLAWWLLDVRVSSMRVEADIMSVYLGRYVHEWTSIYVDYQ